MRLLLAALRELLGLFVGDPFLTLAMLAWVALVALLARAVGPAGWVGLLLFAGLAAILIENVLRAASRGRK